MPNNNRFQLKNLLATNVSQQRKKEFFPNEIKENYRKVCSIVKSNTKRYDLKEYLVKFPQKIPFGRKKFMK